MATKQITTGTAVQHLVIDFTVAGFPTAWVDGVVEDIETKDNGLRDVLLRHADGSIAREIIGKRGGNRKIRRVPARENVARIIGEWYASGLLEVGQ